MCLRPSPALFLSVAVMRSTLGLKRQWWLLSAAACPLASSHTTHLPTGLPYTHSQQPQPITVLGEALSGLQDTPLALIPDKTPPLQQVIEKKREREREGTNCCMFLQLHFNIISLISASFSTQKHTNTHNNKDIVTFSVIISCHPFTNFVPYGLFACHSSLLTSLTQNSLP